MLHSSRPGWCGSVDSMPACEPKGHWFNSWSGQVPGLQARSPLGGVWEETSHSISHISMFLSLFFSLPSSPSKKWINKMLKKIFLKGYIHQNILNGDLGKAHLKNILKYNKTLMCKLILHHFWSIILILVSQSPYVVQIHTNKSLKARTSWTLK